MNTKGLAAFAFLLLFVANIQSAFARHDDDAVECRSENYSRSRCDVPWADARLVQQLSGTNCIRGRTWGFDRRGLWVDSGCSGLFVEAGGRDRRYDRDDYRGSWHPGHDWDRSFSVTCESRDYSYRFCAADVGGGGRIYAEQQISDTPCVEGRTWGWNRAGVWVDGGCAATFVFERRWR